MATAAPSDPRDTLWDTSFETYYDAYYEELLADKLISRWQRLDDITKVLVALTASTSAVSGWALWAEPHAKYIWAILSGFGAALAIIHTTLAVPERIKDKADDKRRFISLRIELDTFRQRMRLDPCFDMAQFSKEFVQYKAQYSQDAQLVKNDLLRTRTLEAKAQSELNRKLTNEIQS